MRRRFAGGGIDPNGWMVTFSDLLNLLLTFFVLFIAMSSMDKQFILESFRFFGAGLGSRIGDSSEYQPTLVEENPALNREVLKELLALEEPEILGGKEMPEELRGAIKVWVDSKSVVLRFADRLLFEPGSSALKPEAEKLIEAVVPIVAGIGAPVEVRGYTDDQPISAARFPSNWDLSIDRAVKVVRLLEGYGVDPKLLSAVGLAHLSPVADNSMPEGRARNRRVEIVVKLAEGNNG